MRKIIKIIVHCTATKEGQNVTAETVRRWHKARGFNDIGYHYLIRLDGTIEKGRDDAVIGAHAVGNNRDSLGVCYVGGLDANGKPKDTRTAAQKESLRKLLNLLRKKYPGVTVYGHHDFDKGKACPCFDAKTEYAV